MDNTELLGEVYFTAIISYIKGVTVSSYILGKFDFCKFANFDLQNSFICTAMSLLQRASNFQEMEGTFPIFQRVEHTDIMEI